MINVSGYNSPLRIVFMGTPDFSVNPLKILIKSKHSVEAVYTQPPRRSGRGMKSNNSPVHDLALSNNIPVLTPPNFTQHEDVISLKEISPDIIIVSAYGIILPKKILSLPRFGCLNIHASLLPRWRGAAPIQRCMMEGDKETGISFMVMDEGLDTGGVIAKFKIPINYKYNGGLLHNELSDKASSELIHTIEGYVSGSISEVPQETIGATYASKILKSESRIDWNYRAEDIFLLIRALNPSPSPWFLSPGGKRIKVLEAAIDPLESKSGEVMDSLTVGCGEKSLRVLKVQPEGGKKMDAKDYLRGNPIEIGSILN